MANKKIASGKRIIKVTHTTKFTHTSAHNDGLAVMYVKDNQGYFCSDSMKDLQYDLAHNNGNLVTVSRFLALENDDKMILDLILEDSFDFLEGFYRNKEQLEEWKQGLAMIVEKREITSCDKLKSIYFPVDDSHKSYHLLTPLYATSLSQQIFIDRTAAKYSKRNDTFTSGNGNIYFADMAYTNYGGEHAKNVSMLNANRGGKGFLFSCQPPVWENQYSQYQRQREIFDGGILRFRSQETLTFLTDFILRFQNVELSLAAPKRKIWLEQWVNKILDTVTAYADEIIFSHNAGWTSSIPNKLNKEYQFWLDPYNDDAIFQQNRQKTSWEQKISTDFVQWLSRNIRYLAEKEKKDFNGSDWIKGLFRDLANEKLRQHRMNLEALQFSYINNENKEELL